MAQLSEFCKIYQTSLGPVLISKDFDQEEDKCLLQIICESENIRSKISHGFNKEESRDAAYDSFTPEHAEQHAENFIKVLIEAQDEEQDEEKYAHED